MGPAERAVLESLLADLAHDIEMGLTGTQTTEKKCAQHLALQGLLVQSWPETGSPITVRMHTDQDTVHASDHVRIEAALVHWDPETASLNIQALDGPQH